MRARSTIFARSAASIWVKLGRMDGDLALFFGRNRERLTQLYAASRAGVLPFCWPGFVFPQAWFLYRKMYGWAALASAGPLVVVYLPHLGFLSWLPAVPGLFGLKLYFAAAERTVRALRAEAPEAEAPALIARAGGVSRIGAAVGLVYGFAAFVATLKAAGG
jgi:hypothetical protein